MSHVYPALLSFDIDDPDRRRAVLEAAETLNLKVAFEPCSCVVHVTVTSPKEAYEFGLCTFRRFPSGLRT